MLQCVGAGTTYCVLFPLDSGTIGFDAITIGNHSRAISDTIGARGYQHRFGCNIKESNFIAIEEKAESNLLVLTRISVVVIVLALAEPELAMFFFEWHEVRTTSKKMIVRFLITEKIINRYTPYVHRNRDTLCWQIHDAHAPRH